MDRKEVGTPEKFVVGTTALFDDGKTLTSPGGKMEILRTLSSDEQKLVLDVWESVKNTVQGTDKPELYWMNVILNGEIVCDCPRVSELSQWVNEQMVIATPSWKKRYIVSVSYVVNPPGSTKNQKFHCDYTYTSANLFIPITKTTAHNSTQFIRTPLINTRMNNYNVFSDDFEDLCESECVNGIEVCQIISNPFSLIYMHPFTPHRGISNTDDYARVMLCVCMDSVAYTIQEKAVYEEVADHDAHTKLWQEEKK